MATFDPTQFNFVELRDYQTPGGVHVFEYNNHTAVQGSKDFLRLNLYLTMDGTYVTIWWGLLEPMFTEAEFADGRWASVEKPADFNFHDSYNEDLFRGHIDSEEAARHIFNALRIGQSHQYTLPQRLSAGADNKLRCDLMAKTD